MSILKTILESLNLRILSTGVIRKAYGIAIKGDRVKDKADYIVYHGAGQFTPVTNFDNWIGSTFWVRNGNPVISTTPASQVMVSCDNSFDHSIPLRLVVVVKKSELPCDDYATLETLAQGIIKATSGRIKSSVLNTPVKSIYVQPRGYSDKFGGLENLPMEYQLCVLDFAVQFTATVECLPDLCAEMCTEPLCCEDIAVSINGELFSTVPAGDQLNIDVEYQNGNPVGEIEGDKFVIPDPGFCADATAVLKNTDGDTLSTTDIPSGASEDITAPDATVVLRNTLLETLDTESFPSGTNGGMIAPDATVNINGNLFDNVPSNNAINVPVRYVNGTPVGSLNAGVWEIPDPVKDLVTRVQFDAGATLDYTITIDSDTAGTYTAAAFSGGMASATYEVNGLPDTLPFTLVATDTPRIIPNAIGVIKLSGTYP